MSETVFYNSRNLVGIGSVGIGTTNPLTTLQLHGSGTGGAPLRLVPVTSGAEVAIGFYRNTDQSIVSAGDSWVAGLSAYSVGDRNFGIGCNTTNILVSLLNSGRVGIGTTNPSAGALLDAYTSGTGVTSNVNISAGCDGSASTANKAAVIFNIKGAGGGIVNGGITHQYFSAGAGTYGFNFQPGAVGTSVMSILGSGNVGIGTTSPVSNLHVYRGTSGTVATFVSAGGGGSYSNVDITSYINGTTGNPVARIAVIDDGTFSGHITFLNKITGVDNNAMSERMRIQSSGYVGIGTNNPGDLLHVAGGSARVRIDAITTGDPMVYFYQDGVAKSYLGFSRAGAYGYWGFGADVIRAYSGSNVPMIPGGAGGGIRYASCDNNGTLGFTPQLANGTLSASAGVIVSSSDSRVKSNISYVTDTALPLIEQLRPAHFVFNGDPGTKKIGFIAQDVEKVIPDAVDGKKYEFIWETNEDGTPKVDANGNLILTDKPRYRGFDATAVLAIAVKAIQELSAKNTALEARIAALEARLV